jgi:hypothetical protein
MSLLVHHEGYFTYVGRADDDVFKASDYRISPLRARKCLDRAPGRGRSRDRSVATPAAPCRSQGLCRIGGGAAAAPRHRALNLSPHTRPFWHPMSASAAANSPICQRASRARSAASNCAPPKPPAAPKTAARPASSGRRISRSSGSVVNARYPEAKVRHCGHSQATSSTKYRPGRRLPRRPVGSSQ